jgi:hypothetical protein
MVAAGHEGPAARHPAGDSAAGAADSAAGAGVALLLLQATIANAKSSAASSPVILLSFID